MNWSEIIGSIITAIATIYAAKIVSKSITNISIHNEDRSIKQESSRGGIKAGGNITVGNKITQI